jgi:hypothetical protein
MLTVSPPCLYRVLWLITSKTTTYCRNAFTRWQRSLPSKSGSVTEQRCRARNSFRQAPRVLANGRYMVTFTVACALCCPPASVQVRRISSEAALEKPALSAVAAPYFIRA